MMKQPGEKIVVQSYKHDETLHRIWANAHVVKHTPSVMIVANKRTKVIESNGRFWFTKEPSVTWFFKDQWFNIIGILRPTGIFYYCNIASPFVFGILRPTGIFYYCNIASPFVLDEEALKYIDYDLDVKVRPDHSYKVLDRGEYNKHKQKMAYSKPLKAILERELQTIKSWIEHKEGPFDHDYVLSLYDVFKSLTQQNTSK